MGVSLGPWLDCKLTPPRRRWKAARQTDFIQGISIYPSLLICELLPPPGVLLVIVITIAVFESDTAVTPLRPKLSFCGIAVKSLKFLVINLLMFSGK